MHSSVKTCLVSFLALVALNAWGQRVQFVPGPPAATVQVRMVSDRASAPAAFELTLSVPAVDLADLGDGFQEVDAEGLAPTTRPGDPRVATTGSLIAVPEGFDPVLTVLNETQRELPGVLIGAAQPKFRCACKKGRTFAFNSALYRSAAVYPQNNVELQEIGRLQNLRLVRVALNPIQMDLGTRTLRVTTHLVLRVSFQANRRVAAPVRLPPSFYRVVAAATVNGSALGPRLTATTGPERMLIVVADSLAQAIQPLVAWKNAKGIQTDVVTFTAAGGSKENVKAYIKNYYDTSTPKPSYLLMVGNKDTLPPYLEDTSSGPAAGDYEFSLLSGDSSQTIPDLFYGRLVADNADEVTTQITRWIAYEKNPDSLDWYHDGTAIAGPKGSNPSDEENGKQIQSILSQNGYKTMDGFYGAEGTATVSNVDQALTAGRSWLTFFGDGSGTGWSWDGTNENYGNSDVEALTNSHLPFIIDVACLNASWYDEPLPFAKAWVTQTSDGQPAGAVAYLGGSIEISWDPPAIMAIGIAKNHFAQSIPSLGGSILAGQLYLIQQSGASDDTTDNLKWYNLLGDPSLVMRTDTPRQFQVQYNTQSTAQGTSVTVTTTDPSGNPMSGLLAALTGSSGALLAAGPTDPTGNVTLTVSGSASGDSLTVTGVNAATYQGFTQ